MSGWHTGCAVSITPLAEGRMSAPLCWQDLFVGCPDCICMARHDSTLEASSLVPVPAFACAVSAGWLAGCAPQAWLLPLALTFNWSWRRQVTQLQPLKVPLPFALSFTAPVLLCRQRRRGALTLPLCQQAQRQQERVAGAQQVAHAQPQPEARPQQRRQGGPRAQQEPGACWQVGQAALARPEGRASPSRFARLARGQGRQGPVTRQERALP